MIYKCIPLKPVDDLFQVVVLEAEAKGEPWSVMQVLSGPSQHSLSIDVKLYTNEKLNWEEAQ